MLMVLACSLGPVRLLAQVSAPSTETVVIDTRAPEHAFPHYWERMFGSGRAILSLRESYRHDLRQVKQATGFDYIRFHAIFHDEIGLYDEDAQGKPVYNFSYIDQIYDGVLENKVRPFVELSFMPKKLASTNNQQPFWYHPYNSPPRDWEHSAGCVVSFPGVGDRRAENCRVQSPPCSRTASGHCEDGSLPHPQPELQRQLHLAHVRAGRDGVRSLAAAGMQHTPHKRGAGDNRRESRRGRGLAVPSAESARDRPDGRSCSSPGR